MTFRHSKLEHWRRWVEKLIDSSSADFIGGGAPEGTDVLSTGEGGGTKFLREDGDGTSSWQAAAGSGDLISTNNLSDLDNFTTSRTNLDVDQAGTDNSDDNAANTTYANDYRAANFVAGTDYEAADATILKDADIGVSVQAFDATNVVDADVVYALLDTNGDVGTSAGQLSIGNHTHTGVYEPADATILKDADIGSTVQAWDTILDGTTASYTSANATTLGTALQDKADVEGVLTGEISSHTHAGGSVDLKPYCVTGSGVNLTTTEATMDLSTEQVSDANYALASDQVTVTAAGTYLIAYGVQVLEDGTGGAARSGTTFHVEIGTTPIVQSEMSNYNRETSGPAGSSTTFIVALSASDVLQLRGFVDYTATSDVSQGVTSMSIMKLA